MKNQKNQKEKRPSRISRFNQMIKRLKNRIALNPVQFTLYTILRILVIVVLIRSILMGKYENAALCVLSLVMFLIPSFAEEKFHIEIPVLFQTIIYLFIFSAQILGEIQNFYVLIPGWDTMLHTMNGFLCAAVGFSIVDLLNQRKADKQLSTIYLTLVAFCFSMTVGVCWEFFEWGMDTLFHLDMQKDTIVQSFSSVSLDPSGAGALTRVSNITETVITTASGQNYTISGGYLDIGINDTMKDLLVNFIGAVAFSFIGYNYTKSRSAANITPAFIIRPETKEETQAISRTLDERQNLSFRQNRVAAVQELTRRRSEPKKEEPNGIPLVTTVWIDIFLNAAGAFILYPQGSTTIIFLFIFNQLAMILCLLIFLFGNRKRTGLWLWTIFSVVAIILNIYRSINLEKVEFANISIDVIGLVSDIAMLVVIWSLYLKQVDLIGMVREKAVKQEQAEREQTDSSKAGDNRHDQD